MKVCILGWYGTETLGDRAILVGILKVIHHIENESDIYLGSLMPSFTNRSLSEDINIYSKVAPKCLITVFDSRKPKQIKEYIGKSDLIIMGGGPLLDISQIEIINYSFVYAKKIHKKTMIFGSGIGPLVYKQNRKIVANILKFTDLAIFRDKRGVEEAKLLNPTGIHNKLYYSHDPAILSIIDYEKDSNSKTKDSICINCRKFPSTAFGGLKVTPDEFLIKMIQHASKHYEKVELVPMHTFHLGNDDRKYLSELYLLADKSNVYVQHEPMNLYELFDKFSTSQACIGMRYHSVVLQTLLNGNNYILDYTESKKGKISGFLNLFGSRFYNNRLINLQEEMPSIDIIEQCISLLKKNESFSYNDSIFDKTLNFYIKNITKLL